MRKQSKRDTTGFGYVALYLVLSATLVQSEHRSLCRELGIKDTLYCSLGIDVAAKSLPQRSICVPERSDAEYSLLRHPGFKVHTLHLRAMVQFPIASS